MGLIMAKDPTTRDLSDRHEEFIETLFGARRTRGSGNQFNDPADNRMSRGRHTPFAYAFEGKSTQRASMSLRLADWQKLVEQAHGLRPALAYRFYRDDNMLVPVLDLVTVEANDFAEILELASIYQEMSDR